MEKKIVGALPVGRTLQDGEFTIERVLGQGATGITYLASTMQEIVGPLGKIRTKVYVALKEFYFKDECQRGTTQDVLIANTNQQAKVDRYKLSFQKEAQKIASLAHENIVHVLKIFEENSTIYYVMQYISGGSIKDYIEAHGKLPVDKAVKFTTQIASAVDYMHAKRMCHYDIKPGNIMISDTDDAMLIDFGIAKNYDENGEPTTTTPPGLTKGYAPLELYSSVAEFSPKIDVYSLGATLYAMLTGVRPPEPMNLLNTSNAMLQPQGVPDWLWQVVCRAMTVGKEERISIAKMVELLKAGSAENSEEVPPLPPGSANSSSAGDPDTVLASGNGAPADTDNVAAGVMQPTEQENAQYGYQHDAQQGATAAKPKAKRGGGKMLFTILAIVLAVAAGAGGYWYWRHIHSAEPTEKPELQQDEEQAVYDADGNKIGTFDGSFKDGKPDGEGTLTYVEDDADGKVRYEGTFVNGSRESDEATLYYNNGDKYVGSFKNDAFDKGVYYISESGDHFDGRFKNNTPWNGVWKNKDGDVTSRVDEGKEI